MWVMPNGWFQMHSECDAFDDTHSSICITSVQCYHILVRTIVSKIFPQNGGSLWTLDWHSADDERFASAQVKPRLKSEAAEVGMRSKMVACWFFPSYLKTQMPRRFHMHINYINCNCLFGKSVYCIYIYIYTHIYMLYTYSSWGQ